MHAYQNRGEATLAHTQNTQSYGELVIIKVKRLVLLRKLYEYGDVHAMDLPEFKPDCAAAEDARLEIY